MIFHRRESDDPAYRAAVDEYGTFVLDRETGKVRKISEPDYRPLCIFELYE